MRIALPLFALFSVAWTRDRVALLVENRSSSATAAGELTPALSEVLTAKGYDVVPAAEVASAVRAARLDGAEAAEPAAMEKLRSDLRAEGVLVVTIRFVLDAEPRARGPRANPAFGVAAVLFGAGGKASWHNSMGWIADDAPAPAVFNFRRGPPKPTSVACERLLWSMPRGRKDPAARPVAAALEQEVPKAPTSTRFAAPVGRLRERPGVARFPLKMDR